MTAAGHVVWIVASAVGAAVIVALVAIYRRAAARHELELAERVIEQAYEACEDRAREIPESGTGKA